MTMTPQDTRRVIQALESIAQSLEKIATPTTIYNLEVRPNDTDIVDTLTGVIDGMESTTWSDMTGPEQQALRSHYIEWYGKLSDEDQNKVLHYLKTVGLLTDPAWNTRRDLLSGKIKVSDL